MTSACSAYRDPPPVTPITPVSAPQWSAGTFVGPKTCVQRSVQCACVLTTRFTMAAGHSQCEGRIRYGSSIAGPGAQSGNRTKDPVAPGTASGMDQCIELPSSSSPSGCGCRNSSHTRARVAVVACLTLLLPDGGRMWFACVRVWCPCA